MSRVPLLALVNVTLALGLALAVRDGVAQQSGGSQPPTLVTTPCGAGHINVCGVEPVNQHCTYTWGINFSYPAMFGITVTGVQCSGGGTQYRYRDFQRETAGGACHVTRPISPDATSTRPKNDDEEIAVPTTDTGESPCD